MKQQEEYEKYNRMAMSADFFNTYRLAFRSFNSNPSFKDEDWGVRESARARVPR